MTGSSDQKLSFRALVALVVGSMIGSGIFALPAAFGRATGGLGALIAWCIAGGGMLMLAFVFQALSRRKPELDTGIYAYARAGFGDYLGFASAAGYWIGCCLADVACLVLIKATLGQFFPVFGDGTTPIAIVSASFLLWSVQILILRGIKGAAALNTVATVAKIVPIGLFIVVAIAAFRADTFSLNFGATKSGTCSAWRAKCATPCSSQSSCLSASRARASTRAMPGIATTWDLRRCWASSAFSACLCW
jgi:arginine:ornithine antiporter/lysine permease